MPRSVVSCVLGPYDSEPWLPQFRHLSAHRYSGRHDLPDVGVDRGGARANSCALSVHSAADTARAPPLFIRSHPFDAMRFNPPPGWPTPPEGWTPPPNWQPAPQWPQMPPGWLLWVPEAMNSTATTPVPWYRRTPWIVVLLVLFFPLGLVLVWTTSSWKKITRAGATLAVVAVIAFISHQQPPQPTDASARSQVAAKASAYSSASTSTASMRPENAGSAARPTTAVVAAPPSQTRTTLAAKAPPVATPSRPTATSPAVPSPPHTSAHPGAPASTRPAAPAPLPALCGAPPNPFGYNFCSGQNIYTPASDVCSYFGCIANFWNGVGFMEQCNDGMYSMSGGRRGACSHHGGEHQAVLKS
jgi:hypothetical protein